jgi:hypothetical protein
MEAPSPLDCPACHRTTVVPLVFGMPPYELALAEERGELILAGCCVSVYLVPNPMQCRRCEWKGAWHEGRLVDQVTAIRLVHGDVPMHHIDW